MPKKTWELYVRTELAVDGVTVSIKRERIGANIAHIPLDAKNLEKLGGDVGRRQIKRIVIEDWR